MQSIDEPREVRKDWRAILREQGRTMVWLAEATSTSYSTVVNRVYRRAPTPQEWEERVYDLLGETPR